ncbi:beta-ketoacyl-ACP synthase II [Leucothrix arctica]|uniref:3-oxoacyl-[acyl-carrier-protein] synthase 2 n=1 Tax=Leucothrix arctica TaxID=1481894 RepID=A0A317CE72_9GAMM|nr:beta-ketoacyl-ACP synthase II [Leucothrix arctica]PWQ96411.1 beta-ketoacyl-[acyl-carrier-protein] synthase II [Leucothrix arctica]
MKSDIVITGMGAITPLGCGVEKVWDRLIAGESGIKLFEQLKEDGSPVYMAGMVPSIADDPEAGLDAESIVPKKDLKKMDRFSLYAMAAAKEALEQANWYPESDEDKMNTATIIGSGIGGFPTITNAQRTMEAKGFRRLSPFVVPCFLANLAAGNVSIKYGFRGPMGCPVTACAAGVQAIGDGARILKSGEAKVALVGGAEACVDPLALASFNAMKALSHNHEDPKGASRPFDKDRDGFVMGEGAGLLVIETREHAEARGAKILAVLSGYGTSCDAHHISSGPDDGAGGAQAMRAALKQSGLEASDIGYVNAHATSTPVGDRAEVAGLRSVFGENVANTPISSTKSSTGHLLGAAGGIETIFTIQALQKGILPPTINLSEPDENFEGLNLIPNVPQKADIKHALCNGLGFGGVNAAVVVSKA